MLAEVRQPRHLLRLAEVAHVDVQRRGRPVRGGVRAAQHPQAVAERQRLVVASKAFNKYKTSSFKSFKSIYKSFKSFYTFF